PRHGAAGGVAGGAELAGAARRRGGGGPPVPDPRPRGPLPQGGLLPRRGSPGPAAGPTSVSLSGRRGRRLTSQEVLPDPCAELAHDVGVVGLPVLSKKRNEV